MSKPEPRLQRKLLAWLLGSLFFALAHDAGALKPLGPGAVTPFAPVMHALDREHFPAIDRWAGQVEALHGYNRTYPPHWRA